MEAISRLVSESFARHGFDRPVDYRRLHWSRWFRCESHHSLLFVPSQPGVFALAEEIMHVGTAAPESLPQVESRGPAEQSSAADVWDRVGACPERSRGNPVGPSEARLPLENAAAPRRMLAVAQFFEDDDMAFVLDRMLSRQNPMRARLVSGRYFVRFVVIEDRAQRHSICSALNQWMVSASEKATGIGSHFATSLELTEASVARTSSWDPWTCGPTKENETGVPHFSPPLREVGVSTDREAKGSSSAPANATADSKPSVPFPYGF